MNNGPGNGPDEPPRRPGIYREYFIDEIDAPAQLGIFGKSHYDDPRVGELRPQGTHEGAGHDDAPHAEKFQEKDFFYRSRVDRLRAGKKAEAFIKKKKAETQRRPEGLVDEFHGFYSHGISPFFSRRDRPDYRRIKILHAGKATPGNVMPLLLFRPATA